MKFGFMSSVCPPLTLAELIDKAKHYNYEHLELRVEWDHGHGVELDSTPQQLRDARQRFADSGIELSCIATGVRFIDPDAQKRAEQVNLLIVKSRNKFTFYEIYVSVIAYELFIRLTQMRA